MTPRAQNLTVMQQLWRQRYGIDAPMKCKPKAPNDSLREYDRLAKAMPRGERA